MSDLDHAQYLLAMAYGDIRALRGMIQSSADNPEHDFFSDEIFGFHAQQAVEKILKARIASLDGFYTKTHDLMALLNILNDLGEDISGLTDLVDLNLFAVQYRYESLVAEDDELDRDALIATVEALFDQIRTKLG
jgi:HEPN domain-containing protein